MRKFLVLALALLIAVLAAGGALAAPDVSEYREVDATSIKLGDTDMGHSTTYESELQSLIASTDLAERLGDKKVYASWNIYTTVATGSSFTIVASGDLPSTIATGIGAIIMTETYTPSETFAVFDTVTSITVTGNSISIPMSKSLTTKASGETTWIFLVPGGSTPGPDPKPEPTPSGGSSGGCNAGFAALALMALPFLLRRKR